MGFVWRGGEWQAGATCSFRLHAGLTLDGCSCCPWGSFYLPRQLTPWHPGTACAQFGMYEWNPEGSQQRIARKSCALLERWFRCGVFRVPAA